MPYRDPERQREANRLWHVAPPPDGQCEETTAHGRRCQWRGWYDGPSGRVLCNYHAARCLR